MLEHSELLELKRWNTPTIYNGWGLAKARVVIKALKKTGLDFTVYTKGKKVYIDIR